MDWDQNPVASLSGTPRIPKEKRSAEQYTELSQRQEKLSIAIAG